MSEFAMSKVGGELRAPNQLTDYSMWRQRDGARAPPASNAGHHLRAATAAGRETKLRAALRAPDPVAGPFRLKAVRRGSPVPRRVTSGEGCSKIDNMEPIRDPEILARFQMTFDLYQTAEDIMRQNLRRRFPEATKKEIERRLLSWLRKEPDPYRDISLDTFPAYR